VERGRKSAFANTELVPKLIYSLSSGFFRIDLVILNVIDYLKYENIWKLADFSFFHFSFNDTIY